MARTSLTSYLEQHGNRYRVVVKVPPSLRDAIGKTKLKASLPPDLTLRQAATLKWPIIARLKEQLQTARTGVRREGLTDEAMVMRDTLRQHPVELWLDERGDPVEAENEVVHQIVDRAAIIEEKHGAGAAKAFADIAFGRATPLTVHLASWFGRRPLSVGYRQDVERALSSLARWLESRDLPQTVEAVTSSAAHDYVEDVFLSKAAHPRTANKDVSCLSSYWRFLARVPKAATSNPWTGQRLDLSPSKNGSGAGKRPFTDREAAALLAGIGSRIEGHFSLISALSGMRQNEIARLTIADCEDGWFNVRRSKTGAGVRKVPIHTTLRPLVKQLGGGRDRSEYLFNGLPEQHAGSKRERGAPIAQAFTRLRRAAKIGETNGGRQADVDFHSWRRWFVRKAVEALESGAQGYTAFTIAHCVGHKIEGGSLEGVRLPLGMTMGVYAGGPSEGSLRACVEAVKLPT